MSDVDFAFKLRAELLEELQQAVGTEAALEQRWMRIGKRLMEFEAEEHWRALDYPSFEQFMVDMRTHYNRGRTTLWGYLATAKYLLPLISAEVLEEIGINKAKELVRAVKNNTGKTLPEDIIATARDPQKTVKELRAAIGQAYHLPADDKGAWFDFDGCFFTKEERKEFVEAIWVTKALLGISNSIPDHIQRKMIFQAWMQEFIGTHAASTNGPEEPTVTEPTLLLAAPKELPVIDVNGEE